MHLIRPAEALQGRYIYVGNVNKKGRAYRLCTCIHRVVCEGGMPFFFPAAGGRVMYSGLACASAVVSVHKSTAGKH